MSDWPPQIPGLPTLNLTEAQVFTALRTFLLGAVASGTEVFRGEVNRVPEPKGDNFIVLWPILQVRRGTNETLFQDNIIVGSIVGTVLTVTGIVRGQLAPGEMLVDKGGLIAVGTVLGMQLSGSLGGTGTYSVSPSQALASGTLYVGVRTDLTQTELTVQLDVHGKLSGDNVKVIESLWRSEYGTAALAASGFALAPLYADDPRQVPFINAEQQIEYRWTLDLHLQVNPVVGTPQQFADEVIVKTIEAGVVFTG